MSGAGSFLSGLANGYQTERGIKDHKKYLDLLSQRAGGEGQASPASGSPNPPPEGTGGAGRSLGTVMPNSGPLSKNARYIYNRFTHAGISPVMAAGLTGNIMQESGPNVDLTAQGDNGTSGYMAMWHGPRLKAFQEWSKQKGVDPNSADAQVDYLIHEGHTTEQGAWDAISKAKTPAEAAQIASQQFWRPSQPHLSNRVSYAKQVYQDMNSNQPAQAPTVVADNVPSQRSIADGMGRGDFMLRRYATN